MSVRSESVSLSPNPFDYVEIHQDHSSLFKAKQTLRLCR